MNSANKLNAYRVAAVNTSSAENLVVMLYDGAIRFLGVAIKAFDREDPLDFNFTVHENITRTQAIIRELNRSLDPEKAGELGDHLVSLYDYFDSRLQEANVQKNKEIIKEIRTRLTELRDAWNESLNQLNEAPAPGRNTGTRTCIDRSASTIGSTSSRCRSRSIFRRIQRAIFNGLTMSLPATTSLLREWHRLAREESIAIALQDWTELNRTIEAKSRLQELLEDYPGEAYTTEDRELVNTLVGITQQHQQLLGNEMDSLRKQIAEEDKSLSNGRKVGAAYGQRAESYWGTYS